MVPESRDSNPSVPTLCCWDIGQEESRYCPDVDSKDTRGRPISKGRSTVDTRRLFLTTSQTDALEMHTKTERETSASCYWDALQLNSESPLMCLWSRCTLVFNRRDAHKAPSAFLGHKHVLKGIYSASSTACSSFVPLLLYLTGQRGDTETSC